MRVRDLLGTLCAVAAVAALAGCGSWFGRGGWGGASKGYPGSKHDMDIVIWLDSQCKVLKSDASIGFDDHNVTWHIRGECQSANGQNMTLTFPNGSPAPTCPQQCTAAIANGAADLSLRIDKNAAGWYAFQLAIGTTKIDPDLEIDP